LRAGLLRAADGPRIGGLRGYIDRVSETCIAGWAQNTDYPEAPVCLDIYADGKLIGQVLANRYRDEFEQAGIGTGHHGFEFTPPAGLDFATDTVEVRRSLDGAALEFSADSRRASQPLAVSTTKRSPNVTVHRRAASA
jgi:erythromycin esterase-like protein